MRRLRIQILLSFMYLFLLSSHVKADWLEEAKQLNFIGDHVKVEKLIRPLAEQENAEAQWMLGLMYENGQGVTRDYHQAVQWYQSAAVQGHAEAQLALGLMYAKAYGVALDYLETVKWLRLAAEQGNQEALFRLGDMHLRGKGVTQDYQEAMKWLHVLATKGIPVGQFKLGLVYEGGPGVTQDKVRAHLWFYLAEREGIRAAKKARIRVAKDMKPQQIIEAEQMAKRCQKSKYQDCD